MSENQFIPINSDLISAISNFNSNADLQQPQQQQKIEPVSQLLNMNLEGTNNMMNLNLDGYFLPNNYATKTSNLNLNVLSSNDLLYGDGSTATSNEISSPDSSSNSRINRFNPQPHYKHQHKISPSLFESEDNLGNSFI